MYGDVTISVLATLTKTPILKKNGETGESFCSFDVAVNYRSSDPSKAKPADFFRCIANRRAAELVATLGPGDGVFFYAKPRVTRNEVVKDGVKTVYNDLVLVVNGNIELLPRKPKGANQPGGYGQDDPQGGQQPGYGGFAPQGGQQPGYGGFAPQGSQPGYGGPIPQGGQPGYGAPAPQGGVQPGYGAPQPGYGGSIPQGGPQPGYGGPAPQGAPQPGYGGPAPQGGPQPGYGGPAQQGGPQPGYGATAPQGGYQEDGQVVTSLPF